MSSRRVVSPLEQQPSRRRRRFEPPGYSNDTSQVFGMEEQDAATASPSVGSSLPSPTSFQAWHKSHGLAQSSLGEHESSSLRITRKLATMVPLDAILSPEHLPFDQHAQAKDRFMDFGNDSDDSEDFMYGWRDNTSTLEIDSTPRASTPGPSTGPSNGPSPRGTNTRRVSLRGTSMRGRAAFGVLQDWKHDQSRRNVTAHPRAAAPPILLLYQLGASVSDSSQQDHYSQPASSSTSYLPLVIASDSAQRSSSFSGTPMYTIEGSHREFLNQQRIGPPRARWMPDEMPVELFEGITQYLSRDDIKAMRLVNREFERGVSRALFDTVVVPFNTEIYDMIEHDRTVKRDLKGKGRADDINSTFDSLVSGSLQWKNAMDDKEDKVYKGHGLRVFEGFGSHIRRFGMSFEVKEDALTNPPRKKALEQMNSYFGSYDWPSVEYTRFEKLAGLERTADETSQMKLAFSHLEKVRHLALCLDSGLGWLSGPDKSMRSQILQHAPPIFGGCSHGLVDAQRQERKRLWRALEKAYSDAGSLDELREGRLMRVRLRTSLHSLQGLSGTSFADTSTWPAIDPSVITDAIHDDVSVAESGASALAGVLLVTPDEPERFERPGTPGRIRPESTRQSPPPFSQTDQRSAYDHLRDFRNATSRSATDKPVPARPRSRNGKRTFSPAHLNQDQKEWLLEADWAQRAFLMSYMLAIVDNKAAFCKTKTLNLARISSHLVPLFYRHDFWEALPNLEDVSVGVIPDWRSVERDEAGFIGVKDVEPSKATEGAYQLLNDYIGLRPNIKKVKFGWAAGGEHAEGCLGRNDHILPAPITTLPGTVKDITQDSSMLQLPFVQHLTLSNCWISPVAIVHLVKNHEKQCLRKVTFDSVSLTAHPRHAHANGGNNHPLPANAAIAAVANPLAMLGFAMNGNGPIPTPPAAQQFANQFWQGPGAGQPHGPWAQGMLQQMQTMMVQNGIQHHQLPLMWSNHPAGMTLGQITHTLTMLAAGGVGAPGMFAGQAGAGAGNAPGVVPNLMLPLPAPPTQALPPAAHQWYDGHREGSWIDIIDALSPGPRLGMYRPRNEFETPYPKRSTPLLSIELKSCGYVRIQNPPFDQNMIEGPVGNRWDNSYFLRRRAALSGAMLSSADKYLGHIVQYMPEREVDAMNFAWGMRTGWEDRDKAREATYDGLLPGGTGRFSGIITKDTPIGDAAMPSA